MKGNVEWHRGENLFGLMVWQLNEIWPTAGWGSLEYGTPYFTPNQVIGGRWKPTHYFYRSMLWRDVFAACGKDGRCYVKNDNALAAFSGSMGLTFVHLRVTFSSSLSLSPLTLTPLLLLSREGRGERCLGDSSYSRSPIRFHSSLPLSYLLPNYSSSPLLSSYSLTFSSSPIIC